jgi:plasmid stabilization system protein ParE
VASRYRTVIWAESAEAALDEVVTYIAQDSRDQAIKVLIRTLEAAASLQTLADRGRIVPELRESDLRELFVFRYRLMYRVAAEQVRIVAFVHGARDFANWHRDEADRPE